MADEPQDSLEITYDSIFELARRLRADNANRNGEYDRARQRVDGVLWGDETNPTPLNRYSLSANYLLPIAQKYVQMLVGRMPAIQVMPYSASMDARLHAEKLEGVLYGIWADSQAHDVFLRAAWDSFVLRRGLVNYYWDARDKRVRFRYVTPDNFYPEYDGETMYHAVYISRRHVEAMKREHPEDAELIIANPAADLAALYGQDQIHLESQHHVTVIDYFDRYGNWARVCGDMFKRANLNHPEPEVPFVEFPYMPSSGDREPKNGIDQLVELVQYLSQLISQKADIIRRFANPTVLDKHSGQSVDAIQRAVSADGSVLPVHRDGNIEFLNWQGTVPAIDEQLQLVLDIIFDISGKPRSSFGQTITNQSGVVTNLSLNPTLQSNEYHEGIWGRKLSKLNRRLLQLTEHFGKGFVTSYRGYRPAGADMRGARIQELDFRGSEVNGWYESRIKWPSAIRTDDPVYIQNVLSRMQSNPPAVSVYTALEELGTEDVEAEIDRILEQLEDPRLYPDRLEASMGAASALGDPALTSGLLGANPPPSKGGGMTEALGAAGNPNRDALA